MRDEIISMQRIFNDMGDDFQLKHINGNQRKRFVSILFQSAEANDDALILDDSVFSGVTFQAMCHTVPNVRDKRMIFSKM